VKHAQEFRDKYQSLCQQLGIEGKEIKKELVQLLSGLPHSYKDIAKQTKKISKACNHYKEFAKRTVGPDTECLPLLKYIIGE
jgi:CDK5 regulatory subunit-associated protein 3